MADYICSKCGWEGPRKKQLRGSKTVEVLIWSILLFPGPIYSLWRRSGMSNQCPNCGLPALVKLSSDAGWMAKRKFDIELGLVVIPPTEKKESAPISFGNENSAETPRIKKPVNPDEW